MATSNFRSLRSGSKGSVLMKIRISCAVGTKTEFTYITSIQIRLMSPTQIKRSSRERTKRSYESSNCLLGSKLSVWKKNHWNRFANLMTSQTRMISWPILSLCLACTTWWPQHSWAASMCLSGTVKLGSSSSCTRSSRTPKPFRASTDATPTKIILWQRVWTGPSRFGVSKKWLKFIPLMCGPLVMEVWATKWNEFSWLMIGSTLFSWKATLTQLKSGKFHTSLLHSSSQNL